MACGCAYSIIGDFHLAEDAAQEAFIDAYRHLRDLREPAAFPGWFRRIVMKHCNRTTRRKQVKADSLDVAGNAAASGDEPASTAERHEMQERVMAAVRALPEHQRMVTSLFYINGYSQRDIADFLEVPVTTVKKRLHDSRKRLRERMIDMVSETLKHNAPDERFSKRIIEGLIGQPRPLEIDGHPIRQIWEMIRGALPEFEVISTEEVVDKDDCPIPQEIVDEATNSTAYHLSEQKLLRPAMPLSTLAVVQGRTPPVRLLAPGRVFGPAGSPFDSNIKVGHVCDVVYIDKKVDTSAVEAIVDKVVADIFGDAKKRAEWGKSRNMPIDPIGNFSVKNNGTWHSICRGGILTSELLHQLGYDPKVVSGAHFGFGLERMVMPKFRIDDVRKLWQPPYVSAEGL